jgi:hypothetical protein
MCWLVNVCISHIISDGCSGNYVYASAHLAHVCVRGALTR